jgi:hypothetical protein
MITWSEIIMIYYEIIQFNLYSSQIVIFREYIITFNHHS